MNIVLVIFDSLRKDCIDVYGAPPWGTVHTPRLNALSRESLTFTRVYPEVMPTLPARRAIYTGQRVYPFHNSIFHLKGDFAGAPGWGPIPEEQDTLSEILQGHGYRTALMADVYHMFKPSKNFWRGFDQWTFLRGHETDPYRSGPEPTQEQIDHWLAPELQTENRVTFTRKCLRNVAGRQREEDYYNARIMIEASRWLEQNRDAERFFLLVESFDPHEPWFVPPYYREAYDASSGREQVISLYSETDQMPADLMHRARMNYSGLVTMCDRWFGHLYETMRVLGMLDNTVLIVTSDHGHSIGDYNYMGKRGLPSRPEVLDIPLFVRHPEGVGAGMRSDLLLQHTDISAQILDFAGVQPSQPLHGLRFWEKAVSGGAPLRDHITVGWGYGVTVIDDRWWLNCKVNGQSVFLHDLSAEQPFAQNVADDHPEVVRRLFAQAVADAGGGFPDQILEFAAAHDNAPGCSDLAALD